CPVRRRVRRVLDRLGGPGLSADRPWARPDQRTSDRDAHHGEPSLRDIPRGDRCRAGTIPDAGRVGGVCWGWYLPLDRDPRRSRGGPLRGDGRVLRPLPGPGLGNARPPDPSIQEEASRRARAGSVGWPFLTQSLFLKRDLSPRMGAKARSQGLTPWLRPV